MLFKISISGLKDKWKNYAILLFGLIMSVSIFYMFQTLALNEVFLEGSSTFRSVVYVFQIGSILLGIITFFYIFYANSFLMSLRQKEFGMYMMLGAKKSKLSLIMFIETLAVGMISIVSGITVGIGLAQAVGNLLMKQLDFTVSGYLPFFMPSVIITSLFFIILFLLSALVNSIKLSKTTILQLIYKDKYEDLPIIKGKLTIFSAFLSIILLSIGYVSMIYMDKLEEAGILIAMLTITTGTYLFFEALFPLFINRLKKNKKRNEKELNSFTYAQLKFRINSLTKILATVTMLIALGAGAISGGMAFKNSVAKSTDSFEIYDTIIFNPDAADKNVLKNIKLVEENEYRFKMDEDFIYYVDEDVQKNPPLIYGENNQQVKRISANLSKAVISEENEKMENKGKEIPDEWEMAIRSMQSVYLGHFEKDIRIVNLDTFNDIPEEEQVTLMARADDFSNYLDKWEELDQLQVAKYDDATSNDFLSKYQIYKGFDTSASGMSFMGFFLGIAFLAMMASVLMFKILSGASIDIVRYNMLYKIGVRKKMLIKSIYKELFLLFLPPALMGMMHVLLGMQMIGLLVIDPYYKIWVPILIFIFIYSIYYFVTVQLYKRIVLSQK